MVSQKGGAGKSTLARLFARELAQDGFTVKIADLDTQQTTSTEWATDRAKAGIEPKIQAPGGRYRPHLSLREGSEQPPRRGADQAETSLIKWRHEGL